MKWILCAIVACALIVLSIRELADKKKGALRIVFILGYLFVACFVIYLPPYTQTYGLLFGSIGDLVNVLRVITIDADVMQFYEVVVAGTGKLFFARIYMLLLGTVHVSLPAFSALTAVTVLFRCFASLQLFLTGLKKRPVFVFSNANERSIHLAKSLENIKCDIIFANSTENALSSDKGSKNNYIFKEESIAELRLPHGRGKDIYLCCISDDENESLSWTLQLIEKNAKRKEQEQKRIHIYQFTQYQDLSIFIDSADKCSLDVQCVNEYEILIYNLLNQYPLFRYGKSRGHILLFGLTPINMVALKAIAWCGQIGSFKMKISVLGVEIAEQISELKVSVPGLFSDRYDIEFYDAQSEKELIDHISTSCTDASYIIVDGESDTQSMNRGIMLRRLFYRLDAQFQSCPPIFCYIKDPSKVKVVTKLATAEANPKRKVSYELIPFGSLEEVYTYDKLMNTDIERISKNVHLAYEEIFADQEIDVREALKRYNIFEVNKRSNRANALHIRYKLNLLGLDYTDDPGAKPVRLEQYYTEELLEELSKAEHNRWMAFLETEGWIPATQENVEAYRASGISRGRHNCPILKMHPYICEYEKLEKLSLALEGKDTTVYDKELILRIPDILGDKWNAANKKFKIIDIKQTTGGQN